ncbi:MAG: hypothetical protein QXU67_05930, partial [Candidatus Bathyarchaeia archaeon]
RTINDSLSINAGTKLGPVNASISTSSAKSGQGKDWLQDRYWYISPMLGIDYSIFSLYASLNYNKSYYTNDKFSLTDSYVFGSVNASQLGQMRFYLADLQDKERWGLGGVWGLGLSSKYLDIVAGYV